MKLYDQILSGLRSFFGMPEATESELHQTLADAGTMEQIKEKANADAKAEIQASLDDMQEKINANTESVNGLKSEVEGLKQELSDAKSALTAKETELTESKKQVETLSGELASLKVEGASKKETTKADEGVKTETVKSDNKSAKVISNETFAAMFQ